MSDSNRSAVLPTVAAISESGLDSNWKGRTRLWHESKHNQACYTKIISDLAKGK